MVAGDGLWASWLSLEGWSTVTSTARSAAHLATGIVRDPDRLLDRRVEQLHVADHQALAVAVRALERGEAVGLGERGGQRLLAQDRQSRLERGRGDVAMRSGGQHDQAVELDAIEHRARRRRIGMPAGRDSARRWPWSSVDDRSQMAAISNASGRRASSGRCTAWATAPSPATPIRRGRRGTRPEGDWAIVAEYTGEPMADGEARRRPT